jgi:osmoprotectant transport system permease protein
VNGTVDTDPAAAADADGDTASPELAGTSSGPAAKLGRIVTPLVVGAAWVLLYLWVDGQELRSLEGRLLTSDNVRIAFTQHLRISFIAAVWILALAIPVGIALTRPWARRISPGVVAAANIGQGVPAVGTIVLAFIVITRSGTTATTIGLVAYGFLPVLRGTMIGLQQVSADVIKAARCLGMSRGEVLRGIELPLSVPVVLTGVRTTLVLTVSTAPLAAFVGGGTLGRFIVSGFAQSSTLLIIVGSVLAGGLALLADWFGGVAEDLLRPKGL